MTPAGLLDTWARRAQLRACDNARASATELARGRVERAEVEAFLAALAAAPPAPPGAPTHDPARAAHG